MACAKCVSNGIPKLFIQRYREAKLRAFAVVRAFPTYRRSRILPDTFPLYGVLLRLLGLPHHKARLLVLVRLIVVPPEFANLDFVQFVRVLDDDCHGPATVRAFRLLNTTSASVDSMFLSHVFIPCKVYAPIVVEDLPTVVRLATAIVFVVLSCGCLPAILVLPSPNYGTTSAYLYTIPSCRVAIGVQKT